MSPPSVATIDGNEAVARVACALNEVVALYPITPTMPMGAKDEQTLRAFLEAESYDGPALIIIACSHGLPMATARQNQNAAVRSGQGLLYRHDPRRTMHGENPLQLDSVAPGMKVREYFQLENRFRMLEQSHSDVASALFDQAQHDADARRALSEYLAVRPAAAPPTHQP